MRSPRLCCTPQQRSISGFGIGTLLCRRSRWLFDAQIAVILGYSAIVAVCLPEFLLHPFAPIVKNLAILAAIWLLRQEARDV